MFCKDLKPVRDNYVVLYEVHNYKEEADKVKKAIILIVLAFLLIFASCGSQPEYEPDTSPTPYPTHPPITPIPVPPLAIHHPTYPPHFIQITGQITSIKGTVTACGAMPEYVDWLEVSIIDENGAPMVLVGTRDTFVPFGGLFAGETVTGFVSPNMPVVESETPTYIAAVLSAGMPQGYGLYVNHYADVERLWQPFALASGDGRVFRVDEDTTLVTNDFWTGHGFAVVYTASETGGHVAVSKVTMLDTHELLCWCYEEESHSFRAPQVLPLSYFEIVDMPIFIRQELFDTPMPPILYHDGRTVMVPFMPIAQEFGRWWTVTWIDCISVRFGTSGGGSGESAMMSAGGHHASGTGLNVRMDVPNINVDGVFYVPLLGFFVGASPFPPSDAFIYNNEIHIVERGWGILHGSWPWQGGWGSSDYPERPITIDVSVLPIFVNGVEIEAPPGFLTDDGFDVMLPVVPIKEALGVEWDDDIIYAPFWEFFRGFWGYGGFISYTRIEIFDTGAQCMWRFWAESG